MESTHSASNLEDGNPREYATKNLSYMPSHSLFHTIINVTSPQELFLSDFVLQTTFVKLIDTLIRPARSTSVSYTAPEIITSPEQRHRVTRNALSNASCCEHYPELLQVSDNRRTYTATKILSIGDATSLDDEYEITSRVITTQAIHEHNLHQVVHFPLLNSADATQEGHDTGLATGVAALHSDPTDGPQTEHTRTFNNVAPFSNHFSRILDYGYQTQSQQQSYAVTYNETDFDTPTYQGASNWPPSSHQEHILDMLGHDGQDIESYSWNMDRDGELTAWGNDLAGIGEHLEGGTNEEYASANEFLVD